MTPSLPSSSLSNQFTLSAEPTLLCERLWVPHPAYILIATNIELSLHSVAQKGMTGQWVIPEEYPVLSDPASSVQLSTQPQWVRSSSSWVSLSWTQYNEMIIRIHELKSIRRPSQMTGLSQITQRLASVLNSHSEWEAVHFLASQSVTVTQRFASVLNPHLRCEEMSFMTSPSVTVISTLLEKDKVKVNPPSTFTSPDDIHLWILKVNNYFNLRWITDSAAQATVACSYLLWT